MESRSVFYYCVMILGLFEFTSLSGFPSKVELFVHDVRVT